MTDPTSWAKLGDDLRHDLIGVVNALAALVSERVGERRGQVGRVRGNERVGGGHHPQGMNSSWEQLIAPAQTRQSNLHLAVTASRQR